MSVTDRLLAGETVTLTELRAALSRALFGDRLGVLLALGSLVWVGLTWRLGFFSNDQYTFANTVLAVADGQLHVTQPVYGPESGATPGTSLADGRVYGRNYGIVLLSAVWYAVLRAVALVADVRVLLAGCWSLALVAVAGRIGTAVGRRRAGLVAGTVAAGVLFGLSLLVADPLPPRWLPLIALQLTTALATAFAAVGCYRLVVRMYDRRLGVAAGVATVVATPVGFWATLPKRHSVTAMLVVCAMYTLYRSRAAATARTSARFRALTYVWPALLAWVHAPLGFILLVAVGVVDLPTAGSNSPRALVTLGTAFGVALMPFLLTNAAISGNALAPPRFLPSYGAGVSNAVATGSTGGSVSDSTVGWLPIPALRVIEQFTGSYVAMTEPARLLHVFVRRGYIPTLRPTQDAAIHLSVVESMPLFGALLAYPALALRRRSPGPDWMGSPRQWSPMRVVDAFSVAYVVLLVGLYFQALPLHHMLTVRYLHPLYAVGVYWLVRVPAVRRAVTSEWRLLTRSYTGTVLVGTGGYLGAIALDGLVLGESVQLYALVALLVAAAVGLWALTATLRGGYRRTGALALGVAAGAMSVYLLAAGLSLFPSTGEFLLPVSGAVSEQIHYARLAGGSPPF